MNCSEIVAVESSSAILHTGSDPRDWDNSDNSDSNRGATQAGRVALWFLDGGARVSVTWDNRSRGVANQNQASDMHPAVWLQY